jgi:proline dehydrogenase
VVRLVSQPYLAGTDPADALRVVRTVNARGRRATVDVLGEESRTPGEALELVETYEHILRRMAAEGIAGNVSVKPSGLGLRIGEGLLHANLVRLAKAAADHDGFVRIDMEGSDTTSITLDLYRQLRRDGIDNVGIVLQAGLRRTLSDIRSLASHRPNVRLCKGIYREPVALAWHDPQVIRQNFARAVEELTEGGSYVAVATHDEAVIWSAQRIFEAAGQSPADHEFQMLMGVRPELGDILVESGEVVRIYVPFGRRWYEYSLRRLRENPDIAGHVARNLVRRIGAASRSAIPGA